ncbi:hypothetical protein V6N13_055840 [Hibiscus sabdariffa]|uniref:S-protein homolog n=1 Tax=Hibiscus sabdariffa TaxID=183260 RepID=A0ABR2BML2_9ROSI
MNPCSIILLLSLASLSAVSGRFISHKAQVLIYNDLAPGTDLVVHCKSKNDDLGVQHVAYGSDFEFRFRPDFWGTTLFHCTMEFNGATHRFDIYDQERDEDTCHHCIWKIRSGGPCLIVNREICYPWRSLQA